MIGDHRSCFALLAVPVSPCCPRVIVNNTPFYLSWCGQYTVWSPAEEETGERQSPPTVSSVVALGSPDILGSSC